MVKHLTTAAAFSPGRSVRNESYRADVYAALEKVDPNAAFRYKNCHAPGKGWVHACLIHPTAHSRKYIPFSCMLRICPECAARLAYETRMHYDLAIRGEVAMQNYKLKWGWRLRMVTLTSSYELAPDVGEKIPYLLDRARDLFKKLWGQPIKTGPHKGAPNGAGAIAALEVGERGKKLHVHMLVWGRFIEQRVISKEWSEQTDGQFAVVDVQDFGQGEKGIRKAIAEGLKYTVKATHLSPQQLADLHMALKRRRRIRSWGSFYKAITTSELDMIYFCPECGAPRHYYREEYFDRLVAEDREADLAASPRLKYTEANNFPAGPSPPDQISAMGLQQPLPLHC